MPQLQLLEDEVNKTTILIDRLLSELTQDINRETFYLSEQRNYMNTLAVGGEQWRSASAPAWRAASMRRRPPPPWRRAPASPRVGRWW